MHVYRLTGCMHNKHLTYSRQLLVRYLLTLHADTARNMFMSTLASQSPRDLKRVIIQLR
jgi:hypothetical protein